MNFLVIIQANAAVTELFAGMSPEQEAAANQSYFDVMNALEESGELVDSKAVHGGEQKSVLVTDNGMQLSEVPTTETRITGYYLVDVTDESRALEIAAMFPEARAVDGVRVARG